MQQTGNLPDAGQLTRAAWQYLDKQEPDKAVGVCQRLNHRFPAHAEGWHVASHTAQVVRKLGKALEFIDKALACDPNNPVFVAQKASLLRLTGRMTEAYALARTLLGVKISSPSASNILGATLSHFDLHEEALAAFDQAVAINSRQPHYHFNRAAELRFLGRVDEAEEACMRVLSLDPENYETYLLRSDLRTQTPDSNHVNELQALLDAGIPDWRSEAPVRFALAKELEDLGDYEKSFSQRQAGANIRRSHMQYNVQLDIVAIDTIIEEFKPELFRTSSAGHENSKAIFILGLPRTGTTLLERILESHTEIRSAGELNNFATEMTRCIQTELGGNAPDSREHLIRLTATMDFHKLGDAYVESTRPLAGLSEHLIDKLPLNYLYAGLIHRALPKAKIIHMRRHPLAACYAVFKQPFRDAYPFSYDLQDLGRYYLAYDRLMNHWRQCIPDEALTEIFYEDLVTDTESEARRMIKFIGQEWQSECLDFHRRKAASTTASATQVRQPVYTSSLKMWRNYEQQLAPLIRLLEEGGVSVGGRDPAG